MSSLSWSPLSADRVEQFGIESRRRTNSLRNERTNLTLLETLDWQHTSVLITPNFKQRISEKKSWIKKGNFFNLKFTVFILFN